MSAHTDGERWRAGYLPGFDAGDVRVDTLAFTAHGRTVHIEVPLLDDVQLGALADRVRDRAAALLAPLPVDTIIDWIDAAALRLLDAHDPFRRELDALLPAVTGFDAEMVRLALQAYLQTFRRAQLQRFVAQDFPNPKVLDGFQPALKGGAMRAFGPRLLVHSWAGNVPGLPLWSFACGLLVKAGNIGKLPSAEPVFASVFARVLAQLRPELAGCFAVVWWPGAQPASANALWRRAQAVVAYGGNDTLRALREQLPVTTRLLGYGHKLGVALVARAALDRRRGPESARLLALDVARHEQQGCYSAHTVYVERGGRIEPLEFARHLGAQLQVLGQRHPRRALTLEESAALAAWRQSAQWRVLETGRGELLGDEGAHWAVAYSDEARGLDAAPGLRCVKVCAVDSLDEVPSLLAPHREFLQTVALAAEPARLYPLAGSLGAAGVTRIAPLGGMTQPEAGWHHDGRFNLADLVRIVEIEQAAERASDRLAPYAQEDAA